MRTLSVETGEHPSCPLCCQPVCGICPQVQSEGLTGPRINVTTRRTRLISPHLCGSSPFTTPWPRRLEEGMWSAFLRAPSPSALEVLADAVQVADALPIPPRAAFAPLLKAVAAKSTHAAVVLRAIARHHPSAAARAGALPALLGAIEDGAPKLRGWTLSAVALMARSRDAHTQALLLEALPTLVAALDARDDGAAWAADALGSLCAGAPGACARAVQLNAVPKLLGLLTAAHETLARGVVGGGGGGGSGSALAAGGRAALDALLACAACPAARPPLCAPPALERLARLVLLRRGG
jgi:hypothetical protein